MYDEMFKDDGIIEKERYPSAKMCTFLQKHFLKVENRKLNF